MLPPFFGRNTLFAVGTRRSEFGGIVLFVNIIIRIERTGIFTKLHVLNGIWNFVIVLK